MPLVSNFTKPPLRPHRKQTSIHIKKCKRYAGDTKENVISWLKDNPHSSVFISFIITHVWRFLLEGQSMFYRYFSRPPPPPPPPQTKPFLSALPCLSLSHFSLCGTHIPSFIPRSSAAPGEAEGVSRHDDTPTSSLQSEPEEDNTHSHIKHTHTHTHTQNKPATIQ